MRKEKTLLFMGIWVAILPFSGFPEPFRNILFVITGLLLVYLAFIYYQQANARISKNENTSKSFVDNIGSGE